MRYIALLLFSIPCPLMAQIPVVIDVPAAGRYVLEVIVAPDGTATIRPLTIHKVTSGGGPIVPPVDGDLTPLSQRVKELTAAVDDTPATKNEFGLLYGAVADGIQKGTIQLDAANRSLALGSNAIVSKTGTGEKWKPWREGVSAELLKLAVAGEYSTQLQITTTLDQIKAGIGAHLTGTQLDPADRKSSVEVLTKLLAIFEGL